MGRFTKIVKTVARVLLILFCFFSLLPAGEKASVGPQTFTVEGEGVSSSGNASAEKKKQEAFVSAFIDGLRKIAEILYGIKTDKDCRNIKNTKNIITCVAQSVGNFEIQSYTEVDKENLNLVVDRIVCKYKAQNITIENFHLVSPGVDTIPLPSWKNPPKSFEGIQIANARGEWDGSQKVWSYTVKLSYAGKENLESQIAMNKVECDTGEIIRGADGYVSTNLDKLYFSTNKEEYSYNVAGKIQDSPGSGKTLTVYFSSTYAAKWAEEGTASGKDKVFYCSNAEKTEKKTKKKGKKEEYYESGKTYRDKKDYDNAIKSLKKAIELDPECWDAYAELADVYLDKKDCDSAQAYFSKIPFSYSEPRRYGISLRLQACLDLKYL